MSTDFWKFMKDIENLPADGVSGDFRIETFTVSKQESQFSGLRRGDYVAEGKYKRLMRGGTVVMSNTQMEISSNYDFVREAKGKVLINGLGLGMILAAILTKPEVTEVTVIEKFKEVVDLTGPKFANDSRVKIINADALEYKPAKGEKFDCVYHDIWDFICADNLEDMAKLHRRYGKKTNWQDSWKKSECQYHKRQSNKGFW